MSENRENVDSDTWELLTTYSIYNYVRGPSSILDEESGTLNLVWAYVEPSIKYLQGKSNQQMTEIFVSLIAT